MAPIAGRPEADWTAILRRRPARLVAGRRVGGYTDVFEIICCECGDNAGLDYREVSPELQRIRGCYRLAVGVAAYEKHVEEHERLRSARRPGGPAVAAGAVRASGPRLDWLPDQEGSALSLGNLGPVHGKRP